MSVASPLATQRPLSLIELRSHYVESIYAAQNIWETPLLSGQVIAALAADPQVMKRTRRVKIVAEPARHDGLVDGSGECPASLRSLKSVLPNSITALREHSWLVPDSRVP